MKFSLKSFSGKVPANGQLDFNVHGDKILAVNIPASGFAVAFDNGEEVFIKSGIQYGSSGWILNTIRNAFPKIADALSGFTYDKISIVNHSAAAANIEFLAGFGDVDDKSTQIVGNVATSDVALVPFENGYIENSVASEMGFLSVYRTSFYMVKNQKYVIFENYGAGDIYINTTSSSEFVPSEDSSSYRWENSAFCNEQTNPSTNEYVNTHISNESETYAPVNMYYHTIRLRPCEKIGLGGVASVVFVSNSPLKLGYLAFK